MTTGSDKAARQAKAAALRATIARLAQASSGGDAATEGQAPEPPAAAANSTKATQAPPSAALPGAAAANPRDFIAQRMRELAAKKK